MNQFYAKHIKRILDIIIAGTAMVLFSWLYVIIAILVRVKIGSPIFFWQERIGQIEPELGEERIFTLLKFRSMSNERDNEGNLLPDSQRLTKFGKILRASSLDELPELWNIVKGDMSIVGPRPWLPKYLPYYNSFEHARHVVRPGLTGYAQINGRNETQWKKRFEYDEFYARNVSFSMDLKIVIQTVICVFQKKGVEFSTNHQTMKEYFETRPQNDSNFYVQL